MRGPSIAAYAVRSVVRNRRATASALVGLVLGVAVATAPWVALDSTVRDLVAYYESGLPMDAFASGPAENLDAAARDLAAVPNVVRAEPLALWLGFVNASRSGLPPDVGWFWFAFVRPSFGSVADELGMSWTAPPSAGSLLVHESWKDAGLVVGDPLVVEHRVQVYDGNGTVVREDVWTATYPVGGFFGTPRPDPPFSANAAFFAAADLDGVRTQLNLSFTDTYGNLYIWLDRPTLLDPFDLGGSSARLERQLILMENALLPQGFMPQYALSSRGPSLPGIPSVLGASMLVLRVLFFVFAIPTLAIAALLAKVGFEVGLAGRRRELSVLRARGLSARGVRLHLLGEATIVGTLGALAGLALAVVLSRFISSRSILGLAGAAPVGAVAISSSTVILAFLLAWALALSVSRTPAKLAASEDLVAALKAFHPEEAAIDYRRSRDFLAAGVAAAGMVLLLAWGSVKDSPIGIVTFFLGFSTAILAPVAPFLLTVAVARYLTRGTSRPYRLLARLFRRQLGELHPLVERNLVRAPRRSSNTALIVTFVLGFVLAISTLVASSQAYREESVLREVPADVVADASFQPVPGLFNTTNRLAVRAISGVASVTPVIETFSDRGNVAVFDARTYLQTVPWLETRHLGGVDPVAVMTALRRGDAFAANFAFQKGSGLLPGDLLGLHQILDRNATVRLYAYVPTLPGLSPSFYYSDPNAPLAYLDFSAVPGANLSGATLGRYLIGVAPGANASAVVDSLERMFPGSLAIFRQDEARQLEAANPLSGAIFGYLQTQAEIAVGILAVAVALLVYSASAERRNELATLIARGIDARTATRLLMAEGWVVALLGAIVGIVGGLVIAATLLALASSISTNPIPIIVPVAVVAPLLAVLVGVWIAGFAGAVSIQRMDVPRVLKLRGG